MIIIMIVISLGYSKRIRSKTRLGIVTTNTLNVFLKIRHVFSPYRLDMLAHHMQLRRNYAMWIIRKCKNWFGKYCSPFIKVYVESVTPQSLPEPKMYVYILKYTRCFYMRHLTSIFLLPVGYYILPSNT